MGEPEYGRSGVVGSGEGRVPQYRDFHEDLAYSDRASEEPFWEAVYRKAFVNFAGQLKSSGDTAAQHMGIDRIVHLTSGAVLRIDEKKRRKVRDNVFLEYQHVYDSGRKAPGWMEKDLNIDYIAYAFIPTRRVLLLPWHLLRAAWLDKKEDWIQRAEDSSNAEFYIARSPNRGYVSYGCTVPIGIVYKSMNRNSIIEVRIRDEKP